MAPGHSGHVGEIYLTVADDVQFQYIQYFLFL